MEETVKPSIDYFWKDMDDYPLLFKRLHAAIFQMTADNIGVNHEINN